MKKIISSASSITSRKPTVSFKTRTWLHLLFNPLLGVWIVGKKVCVVIDV